MDAQTRARLAMFLDAIEDASLVPAFQEQIQQPGLDVWEITQESFLLGLYAEPMRLERIGPSLRMSWAEYWSDARALPEFEQMLKSRNVFPVWDTLGPPPMCRKQ